jgi:hypothetical protein
MSFLYRQVSFHSEHTKSRFTKELSRICSESGHAFFRKERVALLVSFVFFGTLIFSCLQSAAAQPKFTEAESERKEIGISAAFQDLESEDIFLVRNKKRLSICMKNANGFTSKILDCLSSSTSDYDRYLRKLIFRRNLEINTYELFRENRQAICLKVGDEFEGTSQQIMYASCLESITVEELIKKSHSVSDISEFLLALWDKKKVPLATQKKLFNNLKSECAKDARFRIEPTEKAIEDHILYKICVVARTVDEVLKILK